MEKDELYKCLIKRKLRYEEDATEHGDCSEYAEALEAQSRSQEIINILSIMAPTQEEHERLSSGLWDDSEKTESEGFSVRGSALADLKAMHDIGMDEAPEECLKEAVKYLRQWLNKKESAGTQFTLTTNTIDFLDKYDKSVSLKEGQ